MTSAGIQHRVEHGGALSAACATYGGEPSDWLDLSTGINPDPVRLPDIGAHAWQRLPDEDLIGRATAAAAGFYGVAEGIAPLPVAGVQSVIQMLPALFDGRVAIFGPTYEEYRFRFQRAGRTVDMIADIGEINDDHRLVIVVNPNNPDGRVLQRDRIAGMAAMLSERGGFCVVDEAFADVDGGESVAGLAGDIANLVVLRSFGKFFGLAGLRLGFVIAAPRLVHSMRAEQGPWAVSGPALALAAEILLDETLIAATRETILQRRRDLEGVIARSGLTIAGQTPLFVLIKDERAAALHRFLCSRHILTRKFTHAPDRLRLGLSPDGGFDRLEAALTDFNRSG